MAGIRRTEQFMESTTTLSSYKFAAWNPAVLRLLSRDLVELFLAAVFGRSAVSRCGITARIQPTLVVSIDLATLANGIS